MFYFRKQKGPHYQERRFTDDFWWDFVCKQFFCDLNSAYFPQKIHGFWYEPGGDALCSENNMNNNVLRWFTRVEIHTNDKRDRIFANLRNARKYGIYTG